MLNLTCSKEYENLRLDKFLTKNFPTVSMVFWFKLIRTGKIFVNNKKVKINHKLLVNDIITIKAKIDNDLKISKKILSENDLLKIKGDLDVLYEDDYIVLIKKPVGIESQISQNNISETLQNLFLKYLYKKNEYIPNQIYTPSICHRLDRNTSGIIIAAKTYVAEKIIQKKFSEHEILKRYYCICQNRPEKSSGKFVDYLYKDSVKNIVYIEKYKNDVNKEIVTEYKLLDYFPEKNVSFLDINLITGRTHQIRAHLAYHDLPILGDRKYGVKFMGHKFQILHNYCIQFDFKTDASVLNYLNRKKFIWLNDWSLKKKNWKEYINFAYKK